MIVQIKVKSDAAPIRYVEHGIEFSDGTVLDADVVVHATGFASNMRGEVYRLFGAEVGDKVEDFWGLDKEGEISGAFRPSGRRLTHDCNLLDLEVDMANRSWTVATWWNFWAGEVDVSLYSSASEGVGHRVAITTV